MITIISEYIEKSIYIKNTKMKHCCCLIKDIRNLDQILMSN